MTIVTTSEAQATLARLIVRVAQGEEVLITEGGLPVAQLVRPNLQKPVSTLPAAQAAVLESEEDEDNDRPWRGVFAIDSPGDPYPGGKLQLPVEPLPPPLEPVDILWDRVAHSDD